MQTSSLTDRDLYPCDNKTVIYTIALFWVLWVILVNYWNWGGSGNPNIFSQQVRIGGILGTPEPVVDIWRHDSLVSLP